MRTPDRFLSSGWGPVITGAVVGVLAPLLVKWGNPGNMGMCIVCFTRDIAGALGLHRASAVQYLRPEIMGFLWGSLSASLVFKEFRPRQGSSPLLRFLLGMLASFGGLVFLGCPWRAYLRLSGGDGNALWGVLGLLTGVGMGIIFLRRGYSLGRNHGAPGSVGWLMPIFMLILLCLLISSPLLGRDVQGNRVGPIFFSEKGPGSQHAPLLLSLGAGWLIGFLAQRSRFCTVGALRDMMLLRDAHLLRGILSLIGFALVTNMALGQFHPGFRGQPVAHPDAMWNFGGMVLAGLAFTLAGGCPGRQIGLAGGGEADSMQTCGYYRLSGIELLHPRRQPGEAG